MPHTKSAARRLRQNEKRCILNRSARKEAKAAVRAVEKALDGKLTNTTQLNTLLKGAQSELASAAARGYLPKNRANRTISKLAEKVRAAMAGEPTRLNERKRAKLGGFDTPGTHDMKWLDELDHFLTATASSPAQVEAFQNWLAQLHATLPDQWVVYAEGWDDAADLPAYRVLKAFPTQTEAIRWTRTLSEDERAEVTVHFTDTR